LLFDRNSGRTNAPQCYVIRTCETVITSLEHKEYFGYRDYCLDLRGVVQIAAIFKDTPAVSYR